MTFEIQQNDFKGPLHLLLEMVSKKERSIHDFSLNEIIEQFLSYLATFDPKELDLRTEILLVLSILLSIKAQSLFNQDIDEIDYEIYLKRDNLLTKLVQLKTITSVSLALANLLDGDGSYRNPGRLSHFHFPSSSCINLNLENLVRSLLNVKSTTGGQDAEEFDKSILSSGGPTLSLEIAKEIVLKGLTEKDKLSFNEILIDVSRLSDAIVIFLAILDLYKEELVEIYSAVEKIGGFTVSLTRQGANL